MIPGLVVASVTMTVLVIISVLMVLESPPVTRTGEERARLSLKALVEYLAIFWIVAWVANQCGGVEW